MASRGGSIRERDAEAGNDSPSRSARTRLESRPTRRHFCGTTRPSLPAGVGSSARQPIPREGTESAGPGSNWSADCQVSARICHGRLSESQEHMAHI